MSETDCRNGILTKAKSFIKYVVEVFTVSKCPSCQKLVRYSGTLCYECLEKYRLERETSCKYCQLPAAECVCSTRGLKHCPPMGKSLHSYVFYDKELPVFQNLLFHLKKDSDRGAEVFFARELSAELMKLSQNNRQHLAEWHITFPPRTRKSRLDYGFDQSEGMAKRIAFYTGMKFEKVFTRQGFSQKAQKDLSGAMRRKNAENTYSLKKNAEVRGKKYIIVDDVITTGSTMLQCEKLLLRAGAKAVFPISIAKTYFRGAGFDRAYAKNKRPDTAWFM